VRKLLEQAVEAELTACRFGKTQQEHPFDASLTEPESPGKPRNQWLLRP